MGVINPLLQQVNAGLDLEGVDDRVSTLIVPGSNITTNYNDAANTFTISASGSITASANTLVLRDGSGNFSANLITLGATPTDNMHAVTKTYADALGVSTSTASTIVRRDLNGDIAAHALTLDVDPTANLHAVTKQYADGLGSTGTGANTIARRDGSGNLSAATFQGILVGNGSNTSNNATANNVQLNALTAATSGTRVQMPPRFRFQGRVWDTTAATSKTVEGYQDWLPVSGATTDLSGTFRWRYSINAGTVVTSMSLDALTGTLTTVGPVVLPANPTANLQAAPKQYVDAKEPFNVKNYGAIGDGASHPLSAFYGTLAAAQAVYPKATALTNEIDWAAAQTALDAAGVAGGRVVFPAGRYMMSGELVIPEMPSTDDGRNAVDIKGAGMRNTVLEWPTDLGAGKFAIRGPNRVTSYMRTKISDILFYGPRDADTLGVTPANMDGVGVSHRFLLERVRCEWFRAGINIIGDHTNFYHVESGKNYYGVYWDGDATNRGDHNFTSCDINGNKFANLAVHAVNTIDGAIFSGCHLGFAPWGIWIETGTRTLSAVSNTTFTDCSFEAIGNGICGIADARGAYNNIVTTVFTQCSGTQLDSYKIAATPFTAWIMCDVDRSFFLGNHGMFGVHQSNPTALFNGKFTNSHFEDFRDLNYLSNTVAFAKADTGNSTFKRGGVSGIISYVYDDACVYGNVVGHWYESVGAMRAGSMVAGVVIADAPTSAHFGLIATTGIVEVKKTTTAAIAVNDIVQASTTFGQVETATASTRPIVGHAKFGAGSGDATIWMWLQITHRM